MTILIIEGPDLSGKGFLIETIAKKFKDGLLIKNLYKPTNSNDSKIYDQYQKIISMIEQFSNYSNIRFIILDRFYPSQAVYSFLRGVDEYGDKRIKAIEKLCYLRGDYILVYLDTPLDEMIKRYDMKGDEHIKRDDLPILKFRYDKFFIDCTLPKIKLNTLEEGWLEELEKYVKKMKTK